VGRKKKLMGHLEQAIPLNRLNCVNYLLHIQDRGRDSKNTTLYRLVPTHCLIFCYLNKHWGSVGK
jgi:hypothetical protein